MVRKAIGKQCAPDEIEGPPGPQTGRQMPVILKDGRYPQRFEGVDQIEQAAEACRQLLPGEGGSPGRSERPGVIHFPVPQGGLASSRLASGGGRGIIGVLGRDLGRHPGAILD